MSEHVEVLERLRGVLEHGRMEGKRFISTDLVEKAIAALSAPPEAQPVGWATHHETPMLFPSQDEASSYCDQGEHPVPLYAHPPPSAPVGDDRWSTLIGQWQRSVEAAGYDGVEDALDAAVAAKSAPVGVEAVRAARGEILSEAYKHVGTPRRVLLDAVDRIDVALSKQQAAVDEETAWRQGWAIAYSGVNKLYGDDGELQDTSDHPFIDWRRDSATEIRRKIQERGMRVRWWRGHDWWHIQAVTEEVLKHDGWPEKPTSHQFYSLVIRTHYRLLKEAAAVQQGGRGDG